MKEQFRNWNPRTNLNISYTGGNGLRQTYSTNQRELLGQMVAIVEAYQNDGYSLTNRQLYYQLVARDVFPNADKVYKRVCKLITDARYAGVVDWEAIEDRGRTPARSSQWRTVTGLIQSAVRVFRLPRWEDQETYVEMYCEKQALESVLRPVANEYHIYFGPNKGYSSASTVYDIAERLKHQILKGKHCVVLYLGDHDPSGLDMIRDMRDRLMEFIVEGPSPVPPNLEVRQLALNMDQIEEYNPPPNPAKISDPRAAWYIGEYGNVSWELDALPPNVLIQVATDGILDYIDMDRYNAWIAREDLEKQPLIDFGEELTR